MKAPRLCKRPRRITTEASGRAALVGIELLLSRKEAAEILRIAHTTLAKWAVLKTGPRYVVIGGSARYRRADLEAWIEAQGGEPAPLEATPDAA